MTTANTDANDAADRSAEAWVARLASPDWSDADHEVFGAWCAESPEHERDYLRVDRLHARARELSADASIGAATQAARRNATAATVRR